MRLLVWLGGGTLLAIFIPIVIVVASVGPLGGSPVANATASALGLPAQALSAYEQASTQIGSHYPGCTVAWWVLAGVGRVEFKDWAHHTVDATGEVSPPVLGPPLDGMNGTALVTVTAGVPAQALGPMQVTPANWKALGIRLSADGQPPDPQNLGDASVTAALLLCRAAGGGDLSDPARLQAAAHGYNPGGGQAYVDAVVSAVAYFQGFSVSGLGVNASGLYALPVTSTYLTDVVLHSLHHDLPAVDIPMPVGTPVFAVMGGFASPTTDADCGTGVRVVGDDGYAWVYCHGSQLVGTTAGGRIGTGQPIMLSGGAVGEPGAGNSQGPHLHLQITTPAGQLICPGPYLEAWLAGVPMSPAQGQTTDCVG